MAKSIKDIPLRHPSGAMTWESFGPWFQQFLRDEFRLMDVRDPQQEALYGRTVAIPALTDRIANNGQAEDQRFLRQISSANKQSTQNIQPLTANDLGGGLAEIVIAAHTVQYGFGTVAYNAGSIGGLLNSTLYYVYADDPDYEGGAVTYLATTNANNVTGNSDRVYLGAITTPAGGGGGTGGGWGGGGGGGGNPLP